MAGELSKAGGIEKAGIDISETVNQILPRGHSIHGYSSASNERIIKILDRRKYSDSAPLLGFGVDGNAERALARALFTYVLREQDGLDYIKATQYPSVTEGNLPTGHHPSRFDNIVWGGDFWLYQDDDEQVVAGSNYASFPLGTQKEFKATDALGAITKLADNYVFLGGAKSRMKNLPAISLE